jgi:hypothetical protein
VSRTLGGSALLLLAALMLFGFMRSSLVIGQPSTIIALLLTVVAPAAGGIALLRRRSPDDARTRAIRERAVDAEILRLAMQRQGRLTAMEVATELTLQPEEAKVALDGLVTREIADLAMTDAGVIVYTFHDVRGVADKHAARGLLDA